MAEVDVQGDRAGPGEARWARTHTTARATRLALLPADPTRADTGQPRSSGGLLRVVLFAGAGLVGVSDVASWVNREACLA
jgi:hypothetical protein